MKTTKYNLVVIGSGPSGQKGAIAATKLNKRVALIGQPSRSLGGVCLHTGTVPSKTMREAILHLSDCRKRNVYGEHYRHKRRITIQELLLEISQVTQFELGVVEDQLERNRVDIYSGEARFIGPHEVEVFQGDDRSVIEGENILIAVGTKPMRPTHIPFDGHCIFDSDEVLNLERIPRSMIIVGGGVIGIEYASMFATLGIHVTVVDRRERLLEFCDREIVDSLLYHARLLGIVFRLGEEVLGIDRSGDNRAVLRLESGKRLVGDNVVFCVGRAGDTTRLNLQSAGLDPDEHGRLWCNEQHQTWVPHIYAVGDVVGFPALASVSMDQSRRAVFQAFDQPFESCEYMPYRLFTIPEISMVGRSEEQLTSDKVPYKVSIVRGQIVDDQTDMLKLLFHRESRKLLGVHCIGESATEIIHIGQAIMSFGGTIDYFRDTVFNYPTLAEYYNVAAFDRLNKLGVECCLERPQVAEPMSNATEFQSSLDQATAKFVTV